MLEYLKSKEDFVDLIIKHLGTSAVMDLLLRLITSVESPQLRQDLLEVNCLVCNSMFLYGLMCHVIEAVILILIYYLSYCLVV